MELREYLETYNTGKKEDSQVLEEICKNLSISCFRNTTNKYLIDKIVDAFTNIDAILGRFENENEKILDETIRYMLDCKMEKEKVFRIQNILRKWALDFPNIGIVPSIKNSFIARHRDEYIIEHSKQEKKNSCERKYFKYLLFIKEIWESDKDSQIKVLEKYYGDNKEMSDWMIQYLLKPGSENKLNIEKTIIISETYVENLKKEQYLLKTIKDIYDAIFKKGYEKYIDDLNNIYLFQGNVENWLDISKLNGFISDENLNLLKDNYLVDEINDDFRRIIKLTEMGFSIVTEHIVEKWISDKYFIELEDTILIPCNCNPLIISKYIFDKRYILKGTDFLLSFEKRN